MSDEKICPKCGAKYVITKHHCPARDKDSIECNYCNTKLISWNGGCYYEAKEIHGPKEDELR